MNNPSNISEKKMLIGVSQGHPPSSSGEEDF